ncbi:MAG: hypothetical protein ABIG42_03370, partial [bacterium]
NHISALSDISSDGVLVEIPGMFNGTVKATSNDINTDGFNDPITYTAKVANVLGLLEGAYVGLVKVLDSRPPGTSGGEKDTIVHSPDGLDLQWFIMPEFATYQSFKARVRSNSALYTGGVSFGGVARSIAVDSSGGIYITGYFKGTVDFDPSESGETKRTSNGGSDVFVSKFDDKWNFQWVYTFGGNSNDEGKCVDIDSGVYFTGFFEGSVDFNPEGSGDVHNSNVGRDAFLCKIDFDGNFVWAKNWGKAGIWDEGHGLAVDVSGVYVTGYFQGSNVNFNPGGSFTRSSNGDKDVFISKFDSGGIFLWAQTWGGGPGNNDEGNDVATYSTVSNIYVTGYFQGTGVDFDPSIGGTSFRNSGGQADIFVSSLQKNTGNFVWANTWGGGIWDEGFGLAATDTSVYVTGCFEGLLGVDFDPDTGPGNIDYRFSEGGKDAFLSKFDLSGDYLWANTWGAGIWDEGHGLALEFSPLPVPGTTSIYVTGFFQESVDFDPGPFEDWHTANTGKDVFLSKFEDDGDFLWARTWESTGDSEGNGAGTGSAYVVGKFTGWMDLDPGPGEDWHYSSGSGGFVSRLTSQGNYESEPNNLCTEANTIDFRALCNGSVQESSDPDDYWVFTSTLGMPYNIYVYNYSGHNIDLFLYNFDCSNLQNQSTLPGGSDEQIIDEVLAPGVWKILVQSQSDGFNGPREYGLYIDF